jgi:hypothetical protein
MIVARGVVVGCALVAFAARASTPAKPIVYKLYDVSAVSVDGFMAYRVDWTEVQVLPGRHLLQFAAPGCPQSDFEAEESNLSAGQVYRFKWRDKGCGCAGYLEELRDVAARKSP